MEKNKGASMIKLSPFLADAARNASLNLEEKDKRLEPISFPGFYVSLDREVKGKVTLAELEHYEKKFFVLQDEEK
jgi:hypothetical protein